MKSAFVNEQNSGNFAISASADEFPSQKYRYRFVIIKLSSHIFMSNKFRVYNTDDIFFIKYLMFFSGFTLKLFLKHFKDF